MRRLPFPLSPLLPPFFLGALGSWLTIGIILFSNCRVREAIDWAKPFAPDAFLAVGGGSVIDTAKLMNLYTSYPDADFLDFVNAPLGKGRPIDKPLKPLIAVPTTAGTGSETTGTAIFDLVSMRAKTGVAHRNLKPTLGICDPLNTRTMPAAVKASSGLDVLCHSLESWTAIPYYERTPRPANPILRPAYQGANPISDIFSLKALKDCVKYLPRAVRDPDDMEAQSRMLLAATLAGVGFGNAGVHLCHGKCPSFPPYFSQECKTDQQSAALSTQQACHIPYLVKIQATSTPAIKSLHLSSPMAFPSQSPPLPSSASPPLPTRTATSRLQSVLASILATSSASRQARSSPRPFASSLLTWATSLPVSSNSALAPSTSMNWSRVLSHSSVS